MVQIDASLVPPCISPDIPLLAGATAELHERAALWRKGFAEGDDAKEALRLLYVCVTRARGTLIIPPALDAMLRSHHAPGTPCAVLF